jgi:chemotaxis protein CheX
VETNVASTFTRALELVLAEIGFGGIRIQTAAAPTPAAAAGADPEILAMVGLVGDLKGHLVFHFGHDAAVAFVRQLSGHLGMHGEDPGDLQYRKSALAEISNQMGGKATVLLAESGLDCLITPPTVLSGNGVRAVLAGNDIEHFYTVSGNFGTFSFILSLKHHQAA